MTHKEKYMKEHPGCDIKDVLLKCCPEPFENGKCPYFHDDNKACIDCWNQEIPEEKLQGRRIKTGYIDDNPCNIPDEVLNEVVGPIIKDSGNRRQFESGAVRDIQEGKGRCDLLPLDVIGSLLNDPIFELIEKFQATANLDYLFAVLSYGTKLFSDNYTMILEISKHFEEGCKKYGENNWRKGIPAKCYIDSAVRHYLKWLRGDKDEPHDRAFVWNILCCIWTCQNKPELNSYLPSTSEEK